MIDPKTFAASTLQLLQKDPRRYRNFGVYWYFVKALMKRFYKRENLGLLGEYMDPDTMARMPEHADLQSALESAIAEYRQNAAFNLGRGEVEDPVGGGTFLLNDTDSEI
jgi:hypothetical protein